MVDEKLPTPGPQEQEGRKGVVEAPFVSIRFAGGTLFAFLILLAAILWVGAEAHDNNCYSKATVRAFDSSDNSSGTTNCLILPWNEP